MDKQQTKTVTGVVFPLDAGKVAWYDAGSHGGGPNRLCATPLTMKR